MIYRQKMNIENIAAAFRQSAYQAYTNTLIGGAPKRISDAFERMTKPVVGDWVIETSTIGIRGRPDLDGVGILEEIAREKVVFSDSEFEWDEVEDGPWPTEPIHYIRTMDGRRFRWSNASIIAVLAMTPIETAIRDVSERRVKRVSEPGK